MSRSLAIVGVVCALLTGCLNDDFAWLIVDIDGWIDAPDPDAAVTIEFHHAHQGSGALGHPLGWIDEVEVTPAAFTHQLRYPEHAGEGLVLYAWQDVDGDGAFCAPGSDPERSGAVEVTEFPAFEVSVDLALVAACAGPERLTD